MTVERSVIDEVASSACERMTEERSVIDEVASSACERMTCSVNMYIVTSDFGRRPTLFVLKSCVMVPFFCKNEQFSPPSHSEMPEIQRDGPVFAVRFSVFAAVPRYLS